MAKRHGRFVLYPYSMASQGASELATSLNCLRVRQDGTFRPTQPHIIINWGNSKQPVWKLWVSGPTATRFMGGGGRVINHWDNVAVAVDKLDSLLRLEALGVCVPQFTANKRIAEAWFTDSPKTKVLCRSLLRSSEGKGIKVCETAEDLINCPLYVKFFPKETEYRVHVFDGKVIDIQQKKLKNGYKEIDNRSPYIRNSANGWVFCREGVECPEPVQQESIKAVNALGLHFGAVDVAVNNKGHIAVFEVNTAPGIEGTTIEKYDEAFRAI